jgi:RNA 3'-phosphate cyclase
MVTLQKDQVWGNIDSVGGARGLISIDGSHGEGGGQILRTSCALAAITRTPCRIFNIRKKRRNPGLQPQHLIGIRALATLSGARLSGDALGSQEIYFEPGEIKETSIGLEIPTAGSITLVLQTLLLPSFHAIRTVEVNFAGGATDTHFSPTIDYHRFVLLRNLERLGLKATTDVIRRGFYPKGGALVKASIHPGTPSSWNCIYRGKLHGITIISGASEALSKARVAERQAEAAEETLCRFVEAEMKTRIEYYNSLSPGSQINIIADFENVTIGSDSLGKRGKKAEEVGREAAEGFLREFLSDACLDRFASDQILPYLAVADGASTISVSQITEHAKTNMWVIEQFLNRHFEIRDCNTHQIICLL